MSAWRNSSASRVLSPANTTPRIPQSLAFAELAGRAHAALDHVGVTAEQAHALLHSHLAELGRQTGLLGLTHESCGDGGQLLRFGVKHRRHRAARAEECLLGQLDRDARVFGLLVEACRKPVHVVCGFEPEGLRQRGRGGDELFEVCDPS